MNNTRTKKPITLASHLHIKQFLDNRAAAGREFQNVEGEERKALSRALWPLLSQRQRDNYGTVESKKFYKWLTDTMASVRECVIQPQKCNKRFETSRRENPGDGNNFTKAVQAAKNQQPIIQASKSTHEQNDPGRMRKHHGTAAKESAQVKYRTSYNGRATEAAAYERRAERRRRLKREKTLMKELNKLHEQGISQLDSVSIKRLTKKVLHTPGKVVKEFPHLSLFECIEQRKVVAYVGLSQWTDRMKYEPWRFLVDTKQENRSIIQWQLDPSTPATKITLDEAKTLLGFKSVTVYRRAAHSGYEAYMVERTLTGKIDHFELGKQKLIGSRAPRARLSLPPQSLPCFRHLRAY